MFSNSHETYEQGLANLMTDIPCSVVRTVLCLTNQPRAGGKVTRKAQPPRLLLLCRTQGRVRVRGARRFLPIAMHTRDSGQEALPFLPSPCFPASCSCWSSCFTSRCPFHHLCSAVLLFFLSGSLQSSPHLFNSISRVKCLKAVISC